MIVLVLVAAALAATEVVVKRGDTPASIAATWGVDERELRERNHLGATDVPTPGTVLVLPARPGERSDASLIYAAGEVTVRVPGAPSAAGHPGDKLPEGSVVCTGADGFATIRLATSGAGQPHDEIVLLPGTCLTVDSASAVSGGRRAAAVRVDTGSIAVRDAPDAVGEVAIKTASGVTTGGGGGFRVTIEPGAARTEAVGDAVAVIGAGQQVDVAAGEGSRVRTGEAPQAPIKLLPAPVLELPAAGATLDAARFRWGEETAASAFRFEVGIDPDFVALALLALVPGASWRPPLFDLPQDPGSWYWRVEAVDGDGFVGMPAAGRCFEAPAGLVPATTRLRCRP